MPESVNFSNFIFSQIVFRIENHIFASLKKIIKDMTMTVSQNFKEQEIPYECLQDFGLTKEMIDDFPEGVKIRLLTGRTTPVTLPLTYKTTDGLPVQNDARISLFRQEDGRVDIMFWPYVNTADIDEFSTYQKRNLSKGLVLATENEYVQYSETICQVMTLPKEIVANNIDVVMRYYDLDHEQSMALLKAKTVELKSGDNICTIGIDLEAPCSLRITMGDTRKWQQEATNSAKLEKYNFGISGCWVLDESNRMTYVKRGDYTQEMINELAKVNERSNQYQIKQ